MTAERASYLAHVRDYRRGIYRSGPCGYHCRKLGWTRFVIDPETKCAVGEEITDAGLEALNRSNQPTTRTP